MKQAELEDQDSSSDDDDDRDESSEAGDDDHELDEGERLRKRLERERLKKQGMFDRILAKKVKIH